jgi:PEP-CTERM motif
MRRILLASAFLAALAISATAYAAPPSTPLYDFSFSLDGGPTLSFTLDPLGFAAEQSGEAVLYGPITLSDGTTLDRLEFVEPAHEESVLLGPADLEIEDTTLNTNDVFEGPQLYTGDESDPIFTPGTYSLSGDPDSHTFDTESITLTISAAPAVPEPSSLVLLGTGVLGCAGAVRRRFLKA